MLSFLTTVERYSMGRKKSGEEKECLRCKWKRKISEITLKIKYLKNMLTINELRYIIKNMESSIGLHKVYRNSDEKTVAFFYISRRKYLNQNLLS